MEVLRIAMLRENWQCLAEDESPSCVADTSEVLSELSAAPRPGPAQMAGPWKVFDVASVPVPDEAAIGDSPAPTSTSLEDIQLLPQQRGTRKTPEGKSLVPHTCDPLRWRLRETVNALLAQPPLRLVGGWSIYTVLLT